MVVFECSQADFQMVFQSCEAINSAVVEVLFAQFVPSVFDRIEFGRVR